MLRFSATKMFVLTLITATTIVGVRPGLADQFDPPLGYYSTATATSAPTLAAQLNDIIDGHVVRSYGDARQALAILDVDPNNINHLITFYDGNSISKIWDSGATWNREHTWPRSRGVDSSGPDNSDLHMLRPSNPSVNSSRGNKPFGTTTSAYWDPNALGSNDRGEAARTQFYASVRYDGTESSTSNLLLVNSFPSGAQMGNLAEMVEWHYAYPPDARERGRNHLIWNSDPGEWFDPIVNTTSQSYHQGNRNPFVDHPEYAWTIWGSGANNATLFVGGSPNADGSSATLIDLGRVINGTSLPGPTAVPINNSNAHPAAFRVSVTGDAVSPDTDFAMTYPTTPAPAGVLQPTVLVDVATGGPGTYTGAVVIDNVQITSAGTGQGAADADDVITVIASVVTPSNASFDAVGDSDSLLINFGNIAQGSPNPQLSFDVHNLAGTSVAYLDLDSITPSGDTLDLTADLTTFTNLAPSASVPFAATLNTAAVAGLYASTYTLTLSDEDIPGATGGQILMLDLIATIVPPAACSGDIDGDTDTDIIDFGVFSANFGTIGNPPFTNGDLDGDTDVDIIDFGIFVTDFGCTP